MATSLKIFGKKSISAQNFENLDFGQKFRKSRFRSKFSKNFDFGLKFRKSRLRSKFKKKKTISVQIFKNVDFSQNFRKINRFQSKISKISIPVKIFKKKIDFGPKFPKSQLWSKIFISVQNFKTFSKKKTYSAQIFEKFDYGKKSISVQNFENFDFGQNFRKNWISIQNLEYLNFGQICDKNWKSVQNFENLDYGPKIWKSRFRSAI